MTPGLELFKVDRVDDAGGVWLIRGETVEDRPRIFRFKTTDQWKASLCERAMKTQRWVWVTWMDAYRGDPWLRRCEADTTKFEHQEAV